MRALIQRVSEASIHVNGELVGSCGKGLLILLGVGTTDTSQNAVQLWNKIYNLRIFADDAGKTNLSLAAIDGEVLVVSQFTLFADCRKGNRPSFTQAAPQDKGRRLYEEFCALAERDVRHVGRGIFGSNMQVSLTNNGPFTVWLER